MWAPLVVLRMATTYACMLYEPGVAGSWSVACKGRERAGFQATARAAGCTFARRLGGAAAQKRIMQGENGRLDCHGKMTTFVVQRTPARAHRGRGLEVVGAVADGVRGRRRADGGRAIGSRVAVGEKSRSRGVADDELRGGGGGAGVCRGAGGEGGGLGRDHQEAPVEDDAVERSSESAQTPSSTCIGTKSALEVRRGPIIGQGEADGCAGNRGPGDGDAEAAGACLGRPGGTCMGRKGQ